MICNTPRLIETLTAGGWPAGQAQSVAQAITQAAAPIRKELRIMTWLIGIALGLLLGEMVFVVNAFVSL